MRIERVGMSSPKPLPTPHAMVDAIRWAGDFVTGLMNDWPEFPFAYGGVDNEHPNRFPRLDASEADGKRGRTAANMCWELGPDEALIIEFDAHEGLWMITNMGAYFTSMDFLYRPVSYTPSRASVDNDGKVGLILAHQDPGLHNWIDTQGFETREPHLPPYARGSARGADHPARQACGTRTCFTPRDRASHKRRTHRLDVGALQWRP
jgi:hypothetical protein